MQSYLSLYNFEKFEVKIAEKAILFIVFLF